MSLFQSLRRIALTAATAVALSTTAHAAEFATVNTQEILNKSTAAQSLKTQAEAKVKEFQAALKTKSDALSKEEADLAKQRSVMKQEAFEEKAKAFRAKATEAQKDAQDKKAAIDKALSTGFAEIQKTFLDIAAGIAKEKGYKAIVTFSALAYADPSIDISEEVLKQLNAKLPKVTLKFEK